MMKNQGVEPYGLTPYFLNYPNYIPIYFITLQDLGYIQTKRLPTKIGS